MPLPPKFAEYILRRSKEPLFHDSVKTQAIIINFMMVQKMFQKLISMHPSTVIRLMIL